MSVPDGGQPDGGAEDGGGGGGRDGFGNLPASGPLPPHLVVKAEKGNDTEHFHGMFLDD